MSDSSELFVGFICICLMIVSFYCMDKKRESERPLVESVSICNIEGCSLYYEDIIKEVKFGTLNVCVYFNDNTFICTENENVIVKYKERVIDE